MAMESWWEVQNNRRSSWNLTLELNLARPSSEEQKGDRNMNDGLGGEKTREGGDRREPWESGGRGRVAVEAKSRDGTMATEDPCTINDGRSREITPCEGDEENENKNAVINSARDVARMINKKANANNEV